METKKLRRIALGLLITVLTIGLGTSFAYFVSRILLEGNGANTNVKTAQVGDTTITVTGELSFNTEGIYPGHKEISAISVNAVGDREAIYNITWTGTNTLVTPIKYYVYQTNTKISDTTLITCTPKTEGNITKKYWEECETSAGFNTLGEPIQSGQIETFFLTFFIYNYIILI